MARAFLIFPHTCQIFQYISVMPRKIPAYTTSNPHPVLERALLCASNGRTTLDAINEGHRPYYAWLSNPELIFDHRYMLMLQDMYLYNCRTRNGIMYGMTQTNWKRDCGDIESPEQWAKIQRDFQEVLPIISGGHVSEDIGKYLELITICTFLHHGYQVHHEIHAPLRSNVSHPFDAIVNLNRNRDGIPQWTPVEVFYRERGAKSKLKEDFRRISESPFGRGLIFTHGEELTYEDCAMTCNGNIQTYPLFDSLHCGFNLLSSEEYAAGYTNQYNANQAKFANDFAQKFSIAA